MVEVPIIAKKYDLLLELQTNHSWGRAMDHMKDIDKVTDLVRKRPIYSDELADMIDEYGFEVVHAVALDLSKQEETDESNE